MKHKRLIVFALGSAAALTIAGLTVCIPSIRYRLRESELIETLKLRVPPPGEPSLDIVRAREMAARELGEMRSVRAIPYMIQMCGETAVGTDHYAVCGALPAVWRPAIPFLKDVLRLQTEDPLDTRLQLVNVMCMSMGQDALPLLPLLLERYRQEGDDFRGMAIHAIRAIGEPESIKEVAGWTPPEERPRPRRVSVSKEEPPPLQVPVPEPVSEDDPTYSLRESELIEAIKIKGPAREAAVREVGEMRSVRAIPHIIRIWDDTPWDREQKADGGVHLRPNKQTKKEHAAACEALVLIGGPALPFLEEVLRAKIRDETAGTDMNKRLMAAFTCKEMGPVALPLLPVFLKWYRSGAANRTYPVYVIRAIGEPESVAEVAGWTEEPMAGWGPGQKLVAPSLMRLGSGRIRLPPALQTILQREDVGPEDLSALMAIRRRGDQHLHEANAVIRAIREAKKEALQRPEAQSAPPSRPSAAARRAALIAEQRLIAADRQERVASIRAAIEMWDKEGDQSASREALAALGKPALPFLRMVLEDPKSQKRVKAIKTCEAMGPAALPLVLELLTLYRQGQYRDEVVAAIRAIGEVESVREVSGLDAEPPKVKRPPLLQRLKQENHPILRQLEGGPPDGPSAEKK